MLNPASKLLIALSVVGVALGVAYGLAVDERAGVILFLGLAVAAAGAAVAVSGGSVPDVAPWVEPDAPPPERHATTTAPSAPGTGWAFVAAAAVTVLAVGAAVTWEIAAIGAGLVVLATAGWFARVWSEHPSWSRPVRERVSARLLVPLGLPVAAVALALTIAFSVSRILLAVSKNGSVVVALVVAVTILGACAWVASRPRLASSGIVALAGVAALSVVGAGIAGAVAGERTIHPEKEGEAVVRIAAHEVKFDRATIVAKAGEPVTIEFENLDDVYHNVAIYQGEGPEARPIFNGEGFKGPDDRAYHVTAPPAGTYRFVCDFHPNMVGTFVSQAGA